MSKQPATSQENLSSREWTDHRQTHEKLKRKRAHIQRRKVAQQNSKTLLEQAHGAVELEDKHGLSEAELHAKTWNNDGHPLYEALKHAGQGNRLVEVVRKVADDPKTQKLENLKRDVRQILNELIKVVR